MILDKLLSNLSVEVEPFALCHIERGWRLRLPEPPVPLLHFVLKGEGAVSGSADRPQVSTDGGTRPLWSRDGRELFYYLEPGTILAVPVELGTAFTPGRPEVVVQGDYAVPFNAGRHYDVSPDGSRFLLLSDVGAREGEEPVAARIDVVLNWDQELMERVPLN